MKRDGSVIERLSEDVVTQKDDRLALVVPSKIRSQTLAKPLPQRPSYIIKGLVAGQSVRTIRLDQCEWQSL